MDSFKIVTDTLTKYKDSLIVKYVTTDSILIVTDSLRKELLAYKKKVEEAAKLGLYVTYDTIREQAKFLPFDKDFKVQMKETENGVKLFASSFDQFTKTRVGIGLGLSILGGMANGLSSEIINHPWEFQNTFPKMNPAFWDHMGYTGTSSWNREFRLGNIWWRSDLWHISRVTYISSISIAFPITLYETTTWKQVIKRSLCLSLGYVAGYNLITNVIIR